jgi:hypothetical protein
MPSNGFNFSKQRLRKKLASVSGACVLTDVGNSHQMNFLSFVQPMASIVNLLQPTLPSKMAWQRGKIAQS